MIEPINILIPLGGKGTRFAGFGSPKALIPIYGKPMIIHVLDHLHTIPEDNVVIVYNHTLDDHNFAKIVATKYPHIKLVQLLIQTAGASHTIRAAFPHLHFQKTLVLDCDTFYSNDIVSLFRAAPHSTVFFTNKSPDQPPIFSYIRFDPDTRQILDIAEKIKISDHANTGAYGFVGLSNLQHYCETNTLTYNGEPYTSCVIKTMIDAGFPFFAQQLDLNAVFSVGTPKELKLYLESTIAHMFDLDGTLVITDDVYFEVWKHILHLYGGELTLDIFNNYIHGNSDTFVAQTLLPNVAFNPGELSTLKDSLFIQNIAKIRPVPGAIDYLQTVWVAGNPICIVTNCNKRVADAIVDYLGINNLIEFVVSSESCLQGKPSPDPYLFALRKFGVSPDRAIIFEDSKTGILSANCVQPRCIVGLATSYSVDELLLYGADVAIRDFTCPFVTTVSEHKIKRYVEHFYGPATIESKKLKGGFIADVVQVHLLDSSAACILKLENTQPNSLSQMANQLQLYEREYYFYDTVSKYVKNISIPRYIGLVKDDNYKTVGLLLENLFVGGNRIPNLNLNTNCIDTSLKIIDRMANMHAQFWNKPLKTAFPQLKTPVDPCFFPFCGDFISEKWPIFVNKWNKVLSPDQLRIGEHIKDSFASIQLRLAQSNTTFLHGDIKSPNIFYDMDHTCEPIFLDWQHCSIGKGAQDLAFFIVESFDIQKLKTLLPLFSNFYYCKLLEHGVKNYAHDDFQADLRDAFCYVPFFTAVWFGSMPEDELIDKNFPFFFIQKLFAIYSSLAVFL
jgi:HAD superfamily hydrolase (TIGR01509 family)